MVAAPEYSNGKEQTDYSVLPAMETGVQTQNQTQVLIIGGGATGTGIARDLALRGIQSILVEKADLNAGASGANHGLLHSGARYVSSDPGSAIECMTEGNLLKQVAPGCIEDIGGLFIAVKGDDERYVADFPSLCRKCGIPCIPVDIKEAREMEPALSERIICVYRVDDASIDPFKLSLNNMSQAVELGSTLLRHTRVDGFVRDGKSITSVRLSNPLTGRTFQIEADYVINASGAWAGKIAGLAGIPLPVTCSKGSLLVTHSRVSQRIINRLRPSSNADILVPGGTVSILGTTSIRIDDPDHIQPTVREVDDIVGDASEMIPILEHIRYIRAYSGVRPLVGNTGSADDRNISRSFSLIDHGNAGIENFVTITGGKLTTYRLMAEKVSDLVSRRLGVDIPCKTRTETLPVAAGDKWTEPGLAPRVWIQGHNKEDSHICECEMVPESAVNSIIDSLKKHRMQPDLKSIGLRSRIGKGSCQGTFCGARLNAYLYNRYELEGPRGLDGLREFLEERWKGISPLLWDASLIQSELQEAIYCGLFCMELQESTPIGNTPQSGKQPDTCHNCHEPTKCSVN